jgi:DNA invertase Pin-like site-specific DNA recombinase
MRAAVYARVSTTNHGQDPGVQLREFSDYAERRGWTVAGEYVDVGISGAKDRRPELDRLMADAHRRKFDVVVVWKFDRFARSVSHLLRALENFQALGIEFVSLTEGVDTSTPTGKMVFTVLGAVAELERSLIAERVKAGLRNARAKGKRLGRPKVVSDPARIAALRNSGLGWKKIARELGVGVSTVKRIAQEAPHDGSKNPKVQTFRTPRATSTILKASDLPERLHKLSLRRVVNQILPRLRCT